MLCTEGSTASFYCHVEGAVAQYHLHLNRTSINNLRNLIGIEFYSYGRIISYFRMVAEPIMNNSKIQCIGMMVSYQAPIVNLGLRCMLVVSVKEAISSDICLQIFMLPQ